MDFLPRPQLGRTTVEIFQECIAGYTGNPLQPTTVQEADEKRTRLSQFVDAVARSARQYDEHVPREEFQEPPIPDAVSSEACRTELQKVYEQKFAPKNSPGREYYEAIRRSKECGRCPICGGAGGITHLDHYLPKSVYPTLCVHPNNLIPICDTCNTVKRARENDTEDGMPIHLYFDRLPEETDFSGEATYTEEYLFAELDGQFRPDFVIRCPDEWDLQWQKRLSAHMEMYDLNNRYRACVFSEYAMIVSAWYRQLEQSVIRLAQKKNRKIDRKEARIYFRELPEKKQRDLKIKALEAVISGGIASCGDRNSWKYALYCALEGEEPEFAQWLEENLNSIRITARKFEAEAQKQAEEAAKMLEAELRAEV